MKITRTIDGVEHEFELTNAELLEAYTDVMEADLRYEADYQFDEGIVADDNRTAGSQEVMRVHGEPGPIPGYKAYRNAFEELYVNLWYMWEDGLWEDHMPKHMLTVFREEALSCLKPFADDLERHLLELPEKKRAGKRRAVMKKYLQIVTYEGIFKAPRSMGEMKKK